jgi:putative PIN family toxin of toxin-antitoxin system
MNTKAELIMIKSNIRVCRDPKDNFLLSLAKDGKASHLITGDHDLLVLKKTGKTRILTMSDYLNIN